MPTFAEWQAQQGGGAGAPSPGGAPSFADWQAQAGGGSPPGAAPPPPKYAPYDWLQAYDAAQSNVYGDSSQDMIQRIMNDPETAADYQKAVEAGVVSGPGGPVDWSKAPKHAGGDLSGNVMYNSVGGRYGFTDPRSGKPTTSVTGSYYDDPNYGPQALVTKRSANSPELNALRAGAFTMAAMPVAAMLGPAIGSALGTSTTTSNLLANAAVGAGKTLLQGGKVNPYTLAGGVAGGMTGIPFGSTVGSMAGGMVGGQKPNITPLGAGMTFAGWLASQGGK